LLYTFSGGQATAYCGETPQAEKPPEELLCMEAFRILQRNEGDYHRLIYFILIEAIIFDKIHKL